MKGNKRMNRTLLPASSALGPSVVVFHALPSRLAGSMHSDPWRWAGNPPPPPLSLSFYLVLPLKILQNGMSHHPWNSTAITFVLLKPLFQKTIINFKNQSTPVHLKAILSSKALVFGVICPLLWMLSWLSPPLFQASVFWSLLIASHFFDFLPSPIWFPLAFPYQLSEGKWEGETGRCPKACFPVKARGTGDEREGLWGLVFSWFH